MDANNLIHMANRIGDFFDAMPDRPEALEGIAQHIKKFWEPRMRRQFLEAVDGGSATELHAIVREAVDTHRTLLA
jgi:formate dehydrogenase subunit delta